MDSSGLHTVHEIYEKFIRTTPSSKPLYAFHGEPFTAGDLKRNVDRYAALLAGMGARPGVTVGYTLHNRREIFYLYFAIARLGACAMPLFPMIPAPGQAALFQRAGAALVVTDAEQLPALKAATAQTGASYKLICVDPHPDAEETLTGPASGTPTPRGEPIPPHLPLMIAASSGTTGTPKTVLMTQANLAAEIRAAAELATPFTDDCPRGFSSITAFPLSTAGMAVVAGLLFGDVYMIFSGDVSPVAFMELVSKQAADSIAAPPAYLEAILTLPMLDRFDRSSVKRIMTGMDFLSPSLLQRLARKFPNLNRFANGYGLIETTNVILICKGDIRKGGASPVTSRMRLVEGVGNRIDVRDEAENSLPEGGEGTLHVKGPNVVQGYLANDEETRQSFQEGWFRTGDRVRNDGSGCVTLLGRRKHLIKRGGKSVSPVIVQDHINRLHGVMDSVVVGVPHPLYGEMSWAFVVPSEQEAVGLKEVMKHCRECLANYMVPDQVSFLSEIPKKPGVGKIDVDALIARAAQELKTISAEDENHD